MSEKKASKAEAGYREHGVGQLRCDRCKKFEPPAACRKVAGDIDPEAVCNRFVWDGIAGPSGDRFDPEKERAKLKGGRYK